MKVFFTDHAKMRCRERRIDPDHIIKLLRSIPKTEGSFRWRFGKLYITYTVSNDAIIVITVFRKSNHRRVG